MAVIDIEKQLNAWATAIKMVRAGVRPPIVHLATGIPKNKLRALFRECHGYPPPRGRVPDSAASQITSRAMALEAMVFVKIYRNFNGHKSNNSGQTLDSSLVVDAYQTYAAIAGQAALDLSLAWYLVRDIRTGALKVRRCRRCHTEYLHDPRSPYLDRCPLCRS